MPSTTTTARRIKGFIPGISAAQIQEPHVFQGRNFLNDVEGPASVFGSRFITYSKLEPPEEFQTFRVEDEIFLFAKKAVLKLDSATLVYYPVFIYASNGDLWPWTMAKIGVNYFFLRKGLNVIQYNSESKLWSELTGAFIPDNPVAICESGGRLIIVNADLYAWSAQDDGTDFVPSLTTGAGAQSLSLIGGKPYRAERVHNGFMIFTTRGILRAELTGAQNVFRHFVLSSSHIAIGPFAIISAEETGIIFLAKNGFYLTNGSFPEPWQPLMGEFLNNQVLQNRDLSVVDVVRLSYNQDRKWFFCSIGDTNIPNQYTVAYVFHMDIAEWGIFNEVHTGFGELHLVEGPFIGYNFGYVCDQGYAHQFVDYPIKESCQGAEKFVLFEEPFNFPARLEHGYTVFPSNLHMYSYDTTIFEGQGSGWFEAAVEEEFSPAIADAVPPVATDGPVVEDWNALVGGDEDWNLLSGNENWGAGEPAAIFPSEIVMASGLVTSSKAIKRRLYRPMFAEIKVGLFRFLEGKYPDELSEITNIAVGMEPKSGSVEKEDYLNDFKSGDVFVDYILQEGAEDWGLLLNSGNLYGLDIESTIDGENIFFENEEKPVEILNKGSIVHYGCTSVGIFHALHITANELDQSFHLKFLSLNGMPAGRI